jgi:DNA-binding GntR family transcriptional regulator
MSNGPRAPRPRQTGPAPGDAAGWGVSAGDSIGAAIHAAIIDGRLPAGTKLGEEELCRNFGVGRTRIRRTLHQLSFAGLLTLHPNRGAFVASPSLAEAEATYSARRLLEAEIVRTVAQSCTGADIRRLRAHCDAQAEAERNGERRRLSTLLSEFHLLLADLGDNPILKELLAQLLPRTALMQVLYQPVSKHCCGIKEHLNLVTLLAKGDAQGAVQAMCAHLSGNLACLEVERPPVGDIDLAELLHPKPQLSSPAPPTRRVSSSHIAIGPATAKTRPRGRTPRASEVT